MCSIAEIPAAFIAGDSNERGLNGGGPHGWNAALVDGKWVFFDATWEMWDIAPNYHKTSEGISFCDGVFQQSVYLDTLDNSFPVSYWLCPGFECPANVVMPEGCWDVMSESFKYCTRLTVNGALQNPTVYKINGNNYFKIRDLAAVLNGTGKQFDVDYDGALKSVTATTGQPYRANGSELAGAAAGGNRTADPSNDAICIDGQRIDAAVYKINGSNYFKLRDLGQALDFYVGWTQEDGVFIDTGKPYSE